MVSSQPQGVTFTPVTPKLCRFFSPFSGRFPSFVLSVFVFSVVSSLSLFLGRGGVSENFYAKFLWLDVACSAISWNQQLVFCMSHHTRLQNTPIFIFQLTPVLITIHYDLNVRLVLGKKKITILGDALLICFHDHTPICS